MEYLLVYTTFPEEKDAVAISQHILENRLASCINIFPKARSFYNWEGAIQDVSEAIMVLKTRKDLWPALRAALEAGHPYEVPAIVAIDMVDANRAFLSWIDEQTRMLA